MHALMRAQAAHEEKHASEVATLADLHGQNELVKRSITRERKAVRGSARECVSPQAFRTTSPHPLAAQALESNAKQLAGAKEELNRLRREALERVGGYQRLMRQIHTLMRKRRKLERKQSPELRALLQRVRTQPLSSFCDQERTDPTTLENIRQVRPCMLGACILLLFLIPLPPLHCCVEPVAEAPHCASARGLEGLQETVGGGQEGGSHPRHPLRRGQAAPARRTGGGVRRRKPGPRYGQVQTPSAARGRRCPHGLQILDGGGVYGGHGRRSHGARGWGGDGEELQRSLRNRGASGQRGGAPHVEGRHREARRAEAGPTQPTSQGRSRAKLRHVLPAARAPSEPARPEADSARRCQRFPRPVPLVSANRASLGLWPRRRARKWCRSQVSAWARTCTCGGWGSSCGGRQLRFIPADAATGPNTFIPHPWVAAAAATGRCPRVHRVLDASGAARESGSRGRSAVGGDQESEGPFPCRGQWRPAVAARSSRPHGAASEEPVAATPAEQRAACSEPGASDAPAVVTATGPRRQEGRPRLAGVSSAGGTAAGWLTAGRASLVPAPPDDERAPGPSLAAWAEYGRRALPAVRLATARFPWQRRRQGAGCTTAASPAGWAV